MTSTERLVRKNVVAQEVLHGGVGLCESPTYALATREAAAILLGYMRLRLLSIFILPALIAGCAHRFDDHLSSPPVATEPPTAAAQSAYLKPLSSPGAKFAALPPAAQNTIRAEVGVAEIADIVKSTNSTKLVYQISFRNPDTFPTLYVSPNGDVLNPDGSVAVHAIQEDLGNTTIGQNTGVIKLGDLPPNVMRVIQEHAPNAEVSSVSKVIQPDMTFYVVTFKDEAHAPKLRITEDGILLK
jgi:hypothetical protein